MFDGPLKIAVAAAVLAFVAAELLANRTAMLPPNATSTPAHRELPASGVDDGARDARNYGQVELVPDRMGQYHAEVEIDGTRLAMLVDTGATFVTLTYADASMLGLQPMPSDFTLRMATANGAASAALVHLREVRLDTIDVADVPAVVMPESVAGTSLLGMSFLKRLTRFKISDGNLLLAP